MKFDKFYLKKKKGEQKKKRKGPLMGRKGMIRWGELVAMRWDSVVENTLGLYPTVLQLLCMNSSSCFNFHISIYLKQ